MSRWIQIAFFALVVKPLLRVFIGVNLFGREHLPCDGQFILVANHNSHLDTLALLDLFPLAALSRTRPVAAADYFMTNPLLRWFSCNVLNILPIPRTDFTKSNNPLSLMCRAIEAGDTLIVFPEGSRGEPEQIQPFKNGVAHLIHKFPDIPVVPVFLQGMGKSLPKGEMVLIPFFTDIMIGPPRHYQGGKDAITQAMEADIMALQKELSALWRADDDSP